MSTGKKSRMAEWSQRKLAGTAEREAGTAPAHDPALPASSPSAGDALEDDGGEGHSPADLELPDIDSLDGESDFSVFMRDGVPEDLRRLALRKLWASDPVYANLDGLNDYDPGEMSFLVQVAETAQDMLRKALDGEDAGEGPEEESGGADQLSESPHAAREADEPKDKMVAGVGAEVGDETSGPAKAGPGPASSNGKKIT